MVEKASSASLTRHRFLCPRCRSALTPWLRELTLPEALCVQGDETWLLPGGFFALRDAVVFGDGAPTSFDGFPWLIAPLAKRWMPPHPDLSRSTGCCGLRFQSEDKPNLVCMRGHDVGISYRECRGPHWYAIGEFTEQQTERDPHPLVDLEAKRARVRTLVDRPLPGFTAFAERTSNVDHETPDGWLDALWLEAPVLTYGGGQANPTLVLQAKGLPADRAVIMPTPWVQLLRLLCLDETPWGAPEAPLTWKSSGGPVINVSRHEDFVLLTVAEIGASGRLAHVFDAAEWTSAWARLAQTPI